MSNWTPTPQQQAIRTWMADSTINGVRSQNAVVNALAGSGKTSTAIWAIEAAPEDRIILCAFNKRIAEELAERLTNPRAEAKTLHALGYAIVRRYWPNVRVEGKREWKLAERAAGAQAPEAIIGMVSRLAQRLKETEPFPASMDIVEGVAYACEAVPDDEWADAGWGVPEVCRAAIKSMELARERTSEISYSDMLYLPLAHKWATGTYDLVVVDEAQDMSKTQLMLAQKLCRDGGRICVIGDNFQTVYSFRGAGTDTMERLKSSLAAAETGLTVTFRCPKVVVRRAQQIVPDYSCPEDAPEGVLGAARVQELHERVAEGDVVLSRTNAPLAGVCLSLLRAGIKSRIEGRDIGAGLLALVKKWKSATTVDKFLDRLQVWEEREVKRAEKRDDDAKVSLVRDQAETLRALSDGLTSIRELTTRIENLFADSQNGDRDHFVVCSSIHRGKGLEWNRVFLLEYTLYPNRNRRATAGLPDPQEEKNLEYVAVTRAKRELVSVSK